MAITSALGPQPVVVAASTSGVEIAVDPLRSYTVNHTGKSSAAASVTDLVAIGVGAASTAADWTEDANKAILAAGDTVVIPSRKGSVTESPALSIYLKSAANAPMIRIIPGPKEV